LEDGIREDQFPRGGLKKPKSAKLCQKMFPEMQILVLHRGSEKTQQESSCLSNWHSGRSQKLLDFRPYYNHVLISFIWLIPSMDERFE
jgi:hypothetical protein